MTRFNLTKIEREDMVATMQASGAATFDLQKPSYLPDDLDEATTNVDESSIEIEVVDEGALLLGHIRGANEGYDGERWAGGYEPYEPNPYDGTYSEM